MRARAIWTPTCNGISLTSTELCVECMPDAESAALGFRTHSGWASMVAVAGSASKPVVLDRSRIEIEDGFKQPYHAAKQLTRDEAQTLIATCLERSVKLATAAVSASLAELKQNGYAVAGAGIIFASGRALPDLAAILKSHALIHTAEGEFFREALLRASEHCLLPVTRVKERDAP